MFIYVLIKNAAGIARRIFDENTLITQCLFSNFWYPTLYKYICKSNNTHTHDMNKTVYTQKITVSQTMTALSMGSGTMEVFSTPSLCAFMENTAIKALKLNENETSVGVEINIEHTKASAIGETLTARAEVVAHEGHSVYFYIEVKNEMGDVIGLAKHTRVVVDSDRFMKKLEK